MLETLDKIIVEAYEDCKDKLTSIIEDTQKKFNLSLEELAVAEEARERDESDDFDIIQFAAGTIQDKELRSKVMTYIMDNANTLEVKENVSFTYEYSVKDGTYSLLCVIF
jgi:hypothetical protein